jgi:nucleotide-binding universal stress UspA family protein
MARRILVAFDSRELGTRLLDVAARLAAGRKAELHGLYVEETEFLHCAGLPFSKVLPPSGGGWRTLEPQAMERALRARGAELQRELARLAERWQLPWSFRTERGGPGECLISASAEAELVVLGRSSRGGPRRLGRTARRALAECRVPVLILAPDAEIPPRVTAFFTGDTNVLDAAREPAAVCDRLRAAIGRLRARRVEPIEQDPDAWARLLAKETGADGHVLKPESSMTF